MSKPIDPSTSDPRAVYDREYLRLEAVTVSAGFDDLLDFTLEFNHPHLDTMIVVTSFEDVKTQLVCRKHGVICVPTDLLGKNGRNFNKGAAINVGFNRFQYHGWRMVLDADIALPDNARRMLFNYSQLDRGCIHGCDRIDVVGRKAIEGLRGDRQHNHGFLTYTEHKSPVCARYVDGLLGYVPIGYFQLWHANRQQMYPWSLGTASHDDVSFGALWPANKRRLIPEMVVYHLVPNHNVEWGKNWEGRKQARI